VEEYGMYSIVTCGRGNSKNITVFSFPTKVNLFSTVSTKSNVKGKT